VREGAAIWTEDYYGFKEEENSRPRSIRPIAGLG